MVALHTLSIFHTYTLHSFSCVFFLMACLDSNMYNNNNNNTNPNNSQSQPPPMSSPRISFSNDFVDSSLLHHHHHHHHHQYSSSSRSSPPSSDFEFSVSNHNMMSADELFFKGRILPFSFKDTNNKKNKNRNNVMQQRTLRDELLDDHDDGNHVDLSVKPLKSSNGWKGFLGLRKSHIGSRKLPDKTDFEFNPQDPNIKSGSQGVGSNEGSSSTDMEMGV